MAFNFTVNIDIHINKDIRQVHAFVLKLVKLMQCVLALGFSQKLEASLQMYMVNLAILVAA